jgi:hypothetical protein
LLRSALARARLIAHGALVSQANDAEQGIVRHEGIEAFHDEGRVHALERGPEHAEMDSTDYGAVLPRHFGEWAAMEEDPIRLCRRNRLGFEAQIVQQLGSDPDGLVR